METKIIQHDCPLRMYTASQQRINMLYASIGEYWRTFEPGHAPKPLCDIMNDATNTANFTYFEDTREGTKWVSVEIGPALEHRLKLLSRYTSQFNIWLNSIRRHTPLTGKPRRESPKEANQQEVPQEAEGVSSP